MVCCQTVIGKIRIENSVVKKRTVKAIGNNLLASPNKYSKRLIRPSLSIFDSREVVIKYPETIKKTSTPPETDPNQI